MSWRRWAEHGKGRPITIGGERLDAAAALHQITWEWVKGHNGHVVQEAADKAARAIAELGRVDKDLLEDAAASIGILDI